MRKDYYRQQILKIKPFINVGAICKEVGITRQAMYYFLSGVDSALSVDSLSSFLAFVDSL